VNFSGAFDVVIGLLFVFLVFSLVVSGIYEAGARLLASRSRLLWSSLRSLLDGDTEKGDRRPLVGAPSDLSLADELYAHPLIRQLEVRRSTEMFKKSRLSHVPATDFGRAIVDVLVPAGTDATSVQQVRTAINEASIPDSVKRSLLPIASDSAATLDQVRTDIGDWFDSRMAAASRLYRRNTRWIMVCIGFVVVLGFNVNALGVTEELYQDDAMRVAVAEQATGIVDTCASEQPDRDKVNDCARVEVAKIEGQVALPVGWGQDRRDIDGWHVLGWLIAGVAVAQGAPFWFDLLRRGSRLRR
jgi:hypothetical protein